MSYIIGGTPAIGYPAATLQIRTAGRSVVASGTVITGDNKSLEFQLAHLKIVFTFVSDGGSPRMEATSTSNSTLSLTLHNFNNSIGAGTTSPLEIGNLNGQKLWLSYVVYAFSPESTKTVHYTFMLGEPT